MPAPANERRHGPLRCAAGFHGSCLTLVLSAVLAVAAAAEPDFTLPDLDGRLLRLQDYRGRWVVVNVWATWCPPCVEEMPELEDYALRHPDDVAVIGVNHEDIDLPRLREFVDGMSVTYPMVVTGGRPLEGLPRLRGIPTTYIVDPEGRLAATHTGVLTSALLDNLVGGLREVRGEQQSGAR